MGGGGIKAPEVETENAATLKHAIEMIPQRQPAQATKGDQDDHHRGAGHGEAPENGDRRCNRPLLQKNGDPGRAPDNNNQPIE